LIGGHHIQGRDTRLRGIDREQRWLTLSHALGIDSRPVAVNALRIDLVGDVHVERATYKTLVTASIEYTCLSVGKLYRLRNVHALALIYLATDAQRLAPSTQHDNLTRHDYVGWSSDVVIG